MDLGEILIQLDIHFLCKPRPLGWTFRHEGIDKGWCQDPILDHICIRLYTVVWSHLFWRSSTGSTLTPVWSTGTPDSEWLSLYPIRRGQIQRLTFMCYQFNEMSRLRYWRLDHPGIELFVSGMITACESGVSKPFSSTIWLKNLSTLNTKCANKTWIPVLHIYLPWGSVSE